MAAGLEIRIDTRAVAVALELFQERLCDDMSSSDGFVEELIALLDSGRLFRIIPGGKAIRLEPCEEFEALLAEMA